VDFTGIKRHRYLTVTRCVHPSSVLYSAVRWLRDQRKTTVSHRHHVEHFTSSKCRRLSNSLPQRDVIDKLSTVRLVHTAQRRRVDSTCTRGGGGFVSDLDFDTCTLSGTCIDYSFSERTSRIPMILSKLKTLKAVGLRVVSTMVVIALSHARDADIDHLFLPRCRMQTRSSDENSLCLSIRSSVKRVSCDKTEEKSVQIFIQYERSVRPSLVF